MKSVAIILAVMLMIGSGFAGGWFTRDAAADKLAKQERESALAAQAKATEETRKIEKASRDAVDRAALGFDQLVSQINAQRPSTERTIREIYRDVPAPAADCAAPDAVRRMLIALGATAEPPELGAAPGDTGR
jgi:hypothetical protein